MMRQPGGRSQQLLERHTPRATRRAKSSLDAQSLAVWVGGTGGVDGRGQQCGRAAARRAVSATLCLRTSHVARARVPLDRRPSKRSCSRRAGLIRAASRRAASARHHHPPPAATHHRLPPRTATMASSLAGLLSRHPLSRCPPLTPSPPSLAVARAQARRASAVRVQLPRTPRAVTTPPRTQPLLRPHGLSVCLRFARVAYSVRLRFARAAYS
eukprot:5595667-Prymnesium_polylepis.2